MQHKLFYYFIMTFKGISILLNNSIKDKINRVSSTDTINFNWFENVFKVYLYFFFFFYKNQFKTVYPFDKIVTLNKVNRFE